MQVMTTLSGCHGYKIVNIHSKKGKCIPYFTVNNHCTSIRINMILTKM